MRSQAGAVPAIQHAGAGVLCVRDEVLAARRERMPVVGPLRWDRLEFDELRAVPLVDDRVPVGPLVRPGCPGRTTPLGQPEEVPAADLPVPPLLGRERRHFLEAGEPVRAPLEDRGRGRELVRPGAGPDARHRQERPVADGEELRVLATRRGQRGPGLKAAARRFSSSRSVSLSPPFIPGDPPGMSLASCGTARSSWPPTWTGSTARAPHVGYRCTSVRVTCIASLQQPCLCQASNLELLSTTCSVSGCDVSVLDVRKLIMLEAVMAEGSIAAAARRLQYTRSAVSQQISALEAEAGTPLVDRAATTSRSPRPAARW